MCTCAHGLFRDRSSVKRNSWQKQEKETLLWAPKQRLPCWFTGKRRKGKKIHSAKPQRAPSENHASTSDACEAGKARHEGSVTGCARSAPRHRANERRQRGKPWVCSVFPCVGGMPLEQENVKPVDTGDNTPHNSHRHIIALPTGLQC